MRLPFQYRLEYTALIVVEHLLQWLPYRMALGVGWVGAAFLFYICRFRRQETLRRIHEVFGAALPEHNARHIAWRSLRNMIFNCVELMRAPSVDRAWIDRHMPLFAQHVPQVQALIKQYGGAVITVPHMGNWDLAGWACHHYGVKMFSIAGKQKNPLVNDWINRRRETGMTILERGGGTLRQINTLLRQGNVLAILPDVRVYTPDLSIPFLGKTANVGRGMARFAMAARVPIIPAILRREGWTRHGFDLLPPILPEASQDRDTEARRITELVLSQVDAAIRQAPDQWFWYNKRWVLAPVGKRQTPSKAKPDKQKEHA